MSPIKVLALAATVGVLGVATVAAQAGRTPAPEPSHYAIRNARIVAAPGRVIPRGTIVVKDGLIEAIGANATVPAGAWAIDGTNLTVYAGLVDALSTVGLPAALRIPEPRAGATGGGGGAGSGQPATPSTPYSWGPEDRPATTSWLNAADEISTSDERVATWRNAGFTAAVVVPERGFFPGQAAFVSLAGDRPNDMVVKTPVALRVNLQGGPGHRGYPNSLMGAIAYVKQSFFDAQNYDQAWTIYQANPSGLHRPEYDKALEPLRDALRVKRPVLLPGNQAREIQRAYDIAKETGAVPVVYGLQEGYRIPGVVRAAGVPVLVNVDWPVRDKDGDPDADVVGPGIVHARRRGARRDVAHDRGQRLVVDGDGGQRVREHVRRLGHHDRQRLADVSRALRGEDRRHERPVGVRAGGGVRQRPLRLGKILGRPDPQHPGHGRRGGAVHADDARMGVLAADHAQTGFGQGLAVVVDDHGVERMCEMPRGVQHPIEKPPAGGRFRNVHRQGQPGQRLAAQPRPQSGGGVSQPAPAALGAPLEQVDTPALILDPSAFERNQRTLLEAVKGRGVRVRPHAKTHKCPEVGKRQLAMGAVGLCCQKVSEAEAMVEGGITDVLISNEIVGARKLERLAALSRRSTMATSTRANANSPANIRPVGPPPAITTACFVMADDCAA